MVTQADTFMALQNVEELPVPRGHELYHFAGPFILPVLVDTSSWRCREVERVNKRQEGQRTSPTGSPHGTGYDPSA